MWPDECADDLPPMVVGKTDNGRLRDSGMTVEDVFYLGGEEILAAANDHVLAPPDDSAVAALVHHRQVAGAYPAVRGHGLGSCLGHVEIAEHREVPAGQEFSRAANRHRFHRC